MENYLAMRIVDGFLDYVAVVTKYPRFKSDIDDILIEKEKQDLIVN